MMYANLLINYDPVSDFKMTAEQELTDLLPGGDGQQTFAEIEFVTSEYIGIWQSTITVSGQVTAGDTFVVEITRILDPCNISTCDYGINILTITYTAVAGDDTDDVALALIAMINAECPCQTISSNNPTAAQWWSLGSSYPVTNLSFGQLHIWGRVLSATVTNTTPTILEDLGGFKRGAEHEFGIVYSDEKGRTMSVQTEENSSVYVDWYSFDTALMGAARIILKIFSKPPPWATMYRVVYSKNQTVDRFIQYTTSGSSVSSNKMEISLMNLVNEKTENQNLVLSYDFTTGDRIRFVKDDTGVYFTTLVDYEILSFDTGTAAITIDDPSSVISNLGPGMIFELYTPKKTLEDKFFYEIGECYNIGDSYLSTRFHKAADYSDDQDIITGDPAVIYLTNGDIYYKRRNMGTSNVAGGSSEIHTVEDYNFSDFYNSNSISIGRVNVIDDGMKQTRLPATVFVSEVFIPNTNINGLSSFYGYSYDTTISGGSVRVKDYDKRWGSIQRVYAEDKKLNLFQELKVGKA